MPLDARRDVWHVARDGLVRADRWSPGHVEQLQRDASSGTRSTSPVGGRSLITVVKKPLVSDVGGKSLASRRSRHPTRNARAAAPARRRRRSHPAAIGDAGITGRRTAHRYLNPCRSYPGLGSSTGWPPAAAVVQLVSESGRSRSRTRFALLREGRLVEML